MKPQPTPDEHEHLAVQHVLPWHVAGTLPAGEQAMVARHLEKCAACRADAALEQALLAAGPDADALPPGLDPDAALARLMPQLQAVTQLDAMPDGTAAAQGNAAKAPAGSFAGRFAESPAAGSPAAGSPAAGSPAAASPAAAPAAAPSAAASAGSAAAPPAGLFAPRGAARSGVAPRHRWRQWVAAFREGGWRNWALAAQCAVIAGMGVMLWPGVGNVDHAGDRGASAGRQAAYRVLGSGAAVEPDVVVMFQPGVRLDHLQQVLQASGARIVDGPTVTGAYLVAVDPARRPQLLAALRTDAAVRLAEPLGAGAQP